MQGNWCQALRWAMLSKNRLISAVHSTWNKTTGGKELTSLKFVLGMPATFQENSTSSNLANNDATKQSLF